MFHVGQKVVCVDASPAFPRGARYFCKGKIYTVAGFAQEFVEIDGVVGRWYLWRFRPVVTTDISIFEAMLVPTPKEKVEA